MLRNPFTICSNYSELDVHLFDKSDNIHTDSDIIEKLGTDRIASLTQVHGNRMIIVREPTLRMEEADGMWTDVKDLMLTIRVADCQSFIAYAPKQKVIGVLHAGWKGLVAGAISSFIQVANEEWSIDPTELVTGAGPSLCMECAEFSDPVSELKGIDSRLFHGRNADLRGIAHDQLTRAGIKPEHIERHPDCTKCKNDTWWSYRGGDRDAVIEGYTNTMTVCLKG